MTEVQAGGKRPRYQLLDSLRGVAILAMIVFHVAWDLYYFGYSPVDVTTDLGWVIFQKSILSSFLLLVGAGLVLAHGNGIRWRKFWRRFAVLVAGALLVTAGTYWMFPDFFVFFGVLHAIALFSLMGLAFLRLPSWLVAGIGVAVIAANFLYNDPVFATRELGWIGFWPTSPPTSDVVPIFPWFGVVLLGIAGMRLVLASPLAGRLEQAYSNEPVARGLAFIGRWSLAIYIVHQPLIIGLLWGLSQLQAPVLSPPVLTQSQAFVKSCTESCLATGSDLARCDRYCGCAVEQVEIGNLWEAVAATDPTPEQRTQFNAVANLCSAMADKAP
ncbi:heparan-alpha-glucosaminide N-acetyltransferase [Devosia sp.]|uniref:DUF1624 domain-containing protein n=1 Tax=Devosia sp. TaxID=1871048 RepID=UPI002626A5A2|nr:heparan-alpha-glucosaminide N-acetyltransferase [Devosia sp.]